MEQKQFEAMLSDAEVRLRRLKQLYDQWFSGLERIEPAVARKELDDLLGRLRREQIRNTALRFRLQQVNQRYTTFTTYWRRISRQIEEGTYQRDVLKARKLREQLMRGDDYEPELSYDAEVELNPDLAAALEGEQPEAAPRPLASARPISPFAMPLPGQPRAPGTPAGKAAAAGAAAPPATLSNDDVRRIYERYVSARQQNFERTDNVRLESLEKTLRGMLPQLEKKHAGKRIDFEVVVKDGKVALKPVAR